MKWIQKVEYKQNFKRVKWLIKSAKYEWIRCECKTYHTVIQACNIHTSECDCIPFPSRPVRVRR